jgi:hypothetical protein
MDKNSFQVQDRTRQVAHAYDPTFTGGRGRRIVVQGCEQMHKKTLSKKQTKAKRVGGVTQVVEHLPSKHEALSSNSSTAKKQQEEQQQKNQSER